MPILDCAHCGGPLPAGLRCPQCGARQAGLSLRRTMIELALIACAACGSHTSTGVLYGPVVLPCNESQAGAFCESGSGDSGTCNDAGVCVLTKADGG